MKHESPCKNNWVVRKLQFALTAGRLGSEIKRKGHWGRSANTQVLLPALPWTVTLIQTLGLCSPPLPSVLINEAGGWCGRPRPPAPHRSENLNWGHSGGPDFRSPWEHLRSGVNPMGLSQWRPWSHFVGHWFSAAAMMSGRVLKPYPGMTQLRAGAICLCYQSQLFCASKGKYRQLLIPPNT